MHRAWNPTRRNKHAGTKAHGHGNDNRMVVPEAWGEIFYEKLTTHVLVRRDIAGREMRFYVEPARADCFYACSEVGRIAIRRMHLTIPRANNLCRVRRVHAAHSNAPYLTALIW